MEAKKFENFVILVFKCPLFRVRIARLLLPEIVAKFSEVESMFKKSGFESQVYNETIKLESGNDNRMVKKCRN